MEAAMCNRDINFCEMGHEENKPCKERDKLKKKPHHSAVSCELREKRGKQKRELHK